LAAIWRGAKPQYFGKQDYNLTYFPHDQKRVDLQAFLKEERGILEKTEPVEGLFPLF
jgi:hypothetical protein